MQLEMFGKEEVCSLKIISVDTWEEHGIILKQTTYSDNSAVVEFGWEDDSLPECLTPLQLRNVSELAKRDVGIYFLTHKKKLQYIGQTTCAAGRLPIHTQQQNIEFDSVFFLDCNHNELNGYEGALIRFYKPSCNGRSKNGKLYVPNRSTEEQDNKILRCLGLIDE